MTWITIPDDLVRHIWAPDEAPDGEGEISVNPSWYADNGTPVDAETGDDMSYVRTEVSDKTQEAIDLAIQFGGIDGSHHKMWVIDQMLRILLGDKYAETIKEICNGEDGPNTYEWDEGIAP